MENETLSRRPKQIDEILKPTALNQSSNKEKETLSRRQKQIDQILKPTALNQRQ